MKLPALKTPFSSSSSSREGTNNNSPSFQDSRRSFSPSTKSRARSIMGTDSRSSGIASLEEPQCLGEVLNKLRKDPRNKTFTEDRSKEVNSWLQSNLYISGVDLSEVEAAIENPDHNSTAAIVYKDKLLAAGTRYLSHTKKTIDETSRKVIFKTTLLVAPDTLSDEVVAEVGELPTLLLNKPVYSNRTDSLPRKSLLIPTTGRSEVSTHNVNAIDEESLTTPLVIRGTKNAFAIPRLVANRYFGVIAREAFHDRVREILLRAKQVKPTPTDGMIGSIYADERSYNEGESFITENKTSSIAAGSCFTSSLTAVSIESSALTKQNRLMIDREILHRPPCAGYNRDDYIAQNISPQKTRVVIRNNSLNSPKSLIIPIEVIDNNNSFVASCLDDHSFVGSLLDMDPSMSPRSRYIVSSLASGIIPTASSIVRSTPTTHLDYSHFQLGDNAVKPLLGVIHELPAIESINLEDNSLSAEIMNHVLIEVFRVSTLVTLSLSRNQLGNEVFDEINRLLKYDTNCPLNFKLSSVSMSDANVVSLSEGLLERPSTFENTIETLDLSLNRIGYIEVITQKKCGLALPSLARVIQAPHCRLKSLNLSHNSLRGVQAMCLFDSGVLSNSHLIELDLSGNLLDSDFAIELSKRNGWSGKLKTLRLDDNQIGSTGAIVLIWKSARDDNSNLETLSLRGNPIGEAGIGTLLHATLSQTKPIVIDIKNCNVSVSKLADGGIHPFGWLPIPLSNHPDRLRFKLDDELEKCRAEIFLQAIAFHPHWCISSSSILTPKGTTKFPLKEYNVETVGSELSRLSVMVKMTLGDDKHSTNPPLLKNLDSLLEKLPDPLSPSHVADIVDQLDLNALQCSEIGEIADIDRSGRISHNVLRWLISLFIVRMKNVASTLGCIKTYSTDPKSPLNLPSTGVLEVNIVNCYDHRKICISESVFSRFIKIAQDASSTYLLRSILPFCYLTTDSLCELHRLQLDLAPEKALSVVLPYCCPLTLRILVHRLAEKGILVCDLSSKSTILNSLLRPFFGVPSGFYALDLSQPEQRDCLHRLLQLCAELCGNGGGPYINPHQNYGLFRNVYVDGRPYQKLSHQSLFPITSSNQSDYHIRLPIFSTIEFDFNSLTLKPSAEQIKTVPSSEKNNSSSLANQTLLPCPPHIPLPFIDVKSFTMSNDAFMDFLRGLGLLGAAQEAHVRSELSSVETLLSGFYDTWDGTRGFMHPYFMRSRADLESISSHMVTFETTMAKNRYLEYCQFSHQFTQSSSQSDLICLSRFISLAQQRCYPRSMTCSQLRLLILVLAAFPRPTTSFGTFCSPVVDVLVSLLPQVADRRNMEILVHGLLLQDLAALQCRIGQLPLFNPLRMGCCYVLRLENREENFMARTVLASLIEERRGKCPLIEYRPDNGSTANILSSKKVNPEWVSNKSENFPNSGLLFISLHAGGDLPKINAPCQLRMALASRLELLSSARDYCKELPSSVDWDLVFLQESILSCLLPPGWTK